MRRRQIEAALADFHEFLAVVGDAAAGTAHGEGRADDAGEADLVEHLQRLFHAVRQRRARRFQTDTGHGLAEQLPVFGFVDGFFGGADHFHAEFFQHAVFGQIERAVQRGLPAHGG